MENCITPVVAIIIAVLATIITLGEEGMEVRAAIIVVEISVADILVVDITSREQEQSIASDTRPALILCYHSGSEARSSQRGV
jgi:hypothetical protein